jgi:crotonobetainyl-CoA:carnitine CoA-transferase CaiB-like acyl-CoA transferase
MMAEAQSAGALEGIRIIDLARVLGAPYCTQMLADHGATVIKVEPPQGDETREWGPPFLPDGMSAYFSGVNRNKQSVGLDLSKAEGREVLFRLLADADVMTENFKPGTLEKWGLGYDEVLSKRFPRLVHARLTGFGADGPMGGFPGYDAMVQAWAGFNSVNGNSKGGPVRLGLPMVDLGTGLNLAVGILMALVERNRSGSGQFLEVTLYDAAVALQHPHATNWFHGGMTSELVGNAHQTLAPYDQFETRGRNIVTGAGNDPQFRKLCAVIGRAELASDPRFRTNKDRAAHRVALAAAINEAVADRDGEELALELMRSGVPAGVVQSVPDVLSHPHTLHRGMVVEQGAYKGTGWPVKFSRTPASLRAHPPHYGAATRVALSGAGYSDREIDGLIEAGVALIERKKL